MRDRRYDEEEGDEGWKVLVDDIKIRKISQVRLSWKRHFEEVKRVDLS